MGVEIKKTFDHVNVPKSTQKKKAIEALALAKEQEAKKVKKDTLILSTPHFERLPELLNKYFWSTSYKVSASLIVTWLKGQVKEDLYITEEKGVYRVYQKPLIKKP